MNNRKMNLKMFEASDLSPEEANSPPSSPEIPFWSSKPQKTKKAKKSSLVVHQREELEARHQNLLQNSFDDRKTSNRRRRGEDPYTYKINSKKSPWHNQLLLLEYPGARMNESEEEKFPESQEPRRGSKEAKKLKNRYSKEDTFVDTIQSDFVFGERFGKNSGQRKSSNSRGDVPRGEIRRTRASLRKGLTGVSSIENSFNANESFLSEQIIDFPDPSPAQGTPIFESSASNSKTKKGSKESKESRKTTEKWSSKRTSTERVKFSSQEASKPPKISLFRKSGEPGYKQSNRAESTENQLKGFKRGPKKQERVSRIKNFDDEWKREERSGQFNPPSLMHFKLTFRNLSFRIDSEDQTLREHRNEIESLVFKYHEECGKLKIRERKYNEYLRRKAMNLRGKRPN